jgi:hypothetical protein
MSEAKKFSKNYQADRNSYRYYEKRKFSRVAHHQSDQSY